MTQLALFSGAMAFPRDRQLGPDINNRCIRCNMLPCSCFYGCWECERRQGEVAQACRWCVDAWFEWPPHPAQAVAA